MNEETIDEAQKADESQIEIESPAIEELPVESEGENVEETSTEVEETEDAPKEDNRKTAESRIKELVAERKAKEKEVEAEKQRADSLADQMAKLTDGYRPQPLPNYQEPTQDQEISYEELMRRQDALVQLRMAQQENLNRIERESNNVVREHPELDPDSEGFNSDLSQSITEATMAYVQANPTGSVTKFVNGLLKPYKQAVDKQVAGQKETIAKQVSEQAMRPTQIAEQEESYDNLSVDEKLRRMEKKLGIVYR